MSEFIPLLSGKPLCQFTPAEYKAHVIALFFKREKKKRAGGGKKAKGYAWSVTKKGSLVVRVNRNPRWLSREEIDGIARDSGKPLNEVWLKVTQNKNPILISTEAEQKQIAQILADLPW